MIFCDKCRYLYNITKDLKSKQIGGKINEAVTNVMDKYKNREQIEEKDLKRIEGKHLLQNDRYDEMTKKDQRKFLSTIRAVDKNFFVEEKNPVTKVGSNIVYFICKYCNNSKPIKPGTLIYSKKYGGQNTSEAHDYSNIIYDQTLPRTKNYICKNKDCETHRDDSIKEAVLIKNMSDQIVYVCTSCITSWVGSI